MSMSPYNIRPDIKIPLGPTKYPFARMKVGDSFAVDLKEKRRVRSAASHYGTRRKKIKFAVRRIDPLTKTYRCWRIR